MSGRRARIMNWSWECNVLTKHSVLRIARTRVAWGCTASPRGTEPGWRSIPALGSGEPHKYWGHRENLGDREAVLYRCVAKMVIIILQHHTVRKSCSLPTCSHAITVPAGLLLQHFYSIYFHTLTDVH